MKNAIMIVLCAFWAQLAYGQLQMSGSANLSSGPAFTTTFQPGGGSELPSQIDQAGSDDFSLVQSLEWDTPMPFEVDINPSADLSSSLYGESAPTFPDVAPITSNFNVIELTLLTKDTQLPGAGLSLTNLTIDGQAMDGTWSAISPSNGANQLISFFIGGYGNLPLTIDGDLTFCTDTSNHLPPSADGAKLVVSGYQGSVQGVPESSSIFLVWVSVVLLGMRFRKL